MKKYSVLFFVLCSLFILSDVEAKEFKNVFNKDVTNKSSNMLHAIEFSGDGDVVVLGELGVIVKYDKNGEELWRLESDYTFISDIVIDKDENIYTIDCNVESFVVEGKATTFVSVSHLIKYDKEGNLIYAKKLNTSDSILAADMELLEDKYILVNVSVSDYKITGETTTSYTVSQQSKKMVNKYNLDGDFISSTYSYSSNNKTITIKKTGASMGGSRPEKVSGLSLYDDGYYLASPIFANNFYLAKYTKEGKVVYSKQFGGTKDDVLIDVEATSDGGAIAVGYFNSTDISGIENKGFYDIYVLKVNSNGEIEWNKSFGGTESDKGNNIKEYDGGYLIDCTIYSSSIDGYEIKGKNNFIKINKDGEIEWIYNLSKNVYPGIEGFVVKDEEVHVIGAHNYRYATGGAVYSKFSFYYDVDVENNEKGELIVDNLSNKAGDKVTVKVKPKEGYVLGTISGVTVEKIDDETYTFIMPAEDVTLIPEFIIDNTIKESNDPVSLPDSEDNTSIKNPETGDYINLTIVILLLVGIIIFKCVKNKRFYKV